MDDLTTPESPADADGYALLVRQLLVRQLLDSSLSAPAATIVRVRFPEICGDVVCVVCVVCRISVAAAGKPVVRRPAKGGSGATDSWVRVGDATERFHGGLISTPARTVFWGSSPYSGRAPKLPETLRFGRVKSVPTS